jgi:hypothetical protein
MVDADILPTTHADFNLSIIQDNFSKFKWKELAALNAKEIFKLTKGEEILGFIWLSVNPAVFSDKIEIMKVEASKNCRENNLYKYVGTCLIAFACYKSIIQYSGDVILLPLDESKSMYESKLKMEDFAFGFLISDKNNSLDLVKKYLDINLREIK